MKQAFYGTERNVVMIVERWRGAGKRVEYQTTSRVLDLVASAIAMEASSGMAVEKFSDLEHKRLPVSTAVATGRLSFGYFHEGSRAYGPMGLSCCIKAHCFQIGAWGVMKHNSVFRNSALYSTPSLAPLNEQKRYLEGCATTEAGKWSGKLEGLLKRSTSNHTLPHLESTMNATSGQSRLRSTHLRCSFEGTDDVAAGVVGGKRIESPRPIIVESTFRSLIYPGR